MFSVSHSGTEPHVPSCLPPGLSDMPVVHSACVHLLLDVCACRRSDSGPFTEWPSGHLPDEMERDVTGLDRRGTEIETKVLMGT